MCVFEFCLLSILQCCDICFIVVKPMTSLHRAEETVSGEQKDLGGVFSPSFFLQLEVIEYFIFYKRTKQIRIRRFFLFCKEMLSNF